MSLKINKIRLIEYNINKMNKKNYIGIYLFKIKNIIVPNYTLFLKNSEKTHKFPYKLSIDLNQFESIRIWP